MGASGLEVATSQFLGMKTQGYTRVLMAQDAEVKMILQEIAMLHKDRLGNSTRPELRLALLTVSTLMAIDAKNRQGSPPGSAPSADKYADL